MIVIALILGILLTFFYSNILLLLKGTLNLLRAFFSEVHLRFFNLQCLKFLLFLFSFYCFLRQKVIRIFMFALLTIGILVVYISSIIAEKYVLFLLHLGIISLILFNLRLYLFIFWRNIFTIIFLVWLLFVIYSIIYSFIFWI